VKGQRASGAFGAEAIRRAIVEKPGRHAEAVARAILEQRTTYDDPEARAKLAEAVIQAMLEHRAKHGDPKAINHTVQITSTFGSASTSLHEHFSVAGVDVPKTPGHFPFKHLRIPPRPDDVPPGFRVLYLFGDPRNALVSIFRRGLQEFAYRWLHFREDDDIVEWLRKELPAEVRQRLSSLDAFLEAGVDEFQIEDHLDRWLEREHSRYPVLFVRFESLSDTWPSVRDFVGLGSHYPCLELRARSSDWTALPPTQRNQIDALYGGLARRMEALPPIKIR
jgi:hypothetical protein